MLSLVTMKKNRYSCFPTHQLYTDDVLMDIKDRISREEIGFNILRPPYLDDFLRIQSAMASSSMVFPL